MQKIVHDDAIEFPNGEGFTPCSREYALLCDEMEAIKPDYVNLDDLSPEDYQRWNELDTKRCGLIAAGHLGKSVRYDKQFRYADGSPSTYGSDCRHGELSDDLGDSGDY